MKIDQVDIVLAVMSAVAMGIVMGAIVLFEYYCKALGTPLAILVGIGFLTVVILVTYMNYLIEKYHNK
jgi:hypothetical protein